jgi:mRNA-degrading endonuclease YafQ of YafQ-DinJ toxin-antitoxin module
MEIFINEVSLEGQYTSESEFVRAVKDFIEIFKLLSKKTNNKQIYKDSKLLVNYKAVRESNFSASLNLIKDKSVKQNFVDIVFNKQNPQEWRKEQLHCPDDLFDYLNNEISKNVTDTSLAEVSERSLRNKDSIYLVINFKSSTFNLLHPDIKECCIIPIIKNNDETQPIKLDGIDSYLALQNWLEIKLSLSRIEYDFLSRYPPKDQQTILRDTQRFQKTQNLYDGRSVYREVQSDRYWYVDNFHYGQASHIEVFNAQGDHIGESDLDGNIDETKKDSNKMIDLS